MKKNFYDLLTKEFRPYYMKYTHEIFVQEYIDTYVKNHNTQPNEDQINLFNQVLIACGRVKEKVDNDINDFYQSANKKQNILFFVDVSIYFMIIYLCLSYFFTYPANPFTIQSINKEFFQNTIAFYNSIVLFCIMLMFIFKKKQ